LFLFAHRGSGPTSRSVSTCWRFGVSCAYVRFGALTALVPARAWGSCGGSDDGGGGTRPGTGTSTPNDHAGANAVHDCGELFRLHLDHRGGCRELAEIGWPMLGSADVRREPGLPRRERCPTQARWRTPSTARRRLVNLSVDDPAQAAQFGSGSQKSQRPASSRLRGCYGR